ncbi:hypothetical protein LXL04_023799 [Taraxacum kok-saghyz]
MTSLAGSRTVWPTSVQYISAQYTESLNHKKWSNSVGNYRRIRYMFDDADAGDWCKEEEGRLLQGRLTEYSLFMQENNYEDEEQFINALREGSDKYIRGAGFERLALVFILDLDLIHPMGQAHDLVYDTK